MVLMFQKEVALRLTAAPGTADYGRLAVMAQLPVPGRAPVRPAAGGLHAAAQGQLQRGPPDAAARAALGPSCAPRWRELTRAAFGQRRKMLRSSLRGFAADPLALLATAGIEPTRRAEELDIGQFRRLAELHLAGRAA